MAFPGDHLGVPNMERIVGAIDNTPHGLALKELHEMLPKCVTRDDDYVRRVKDSLQETTMDVFHSYEKVISDWTTKMEVAFSRLLQRSCWGDDSAPPKEIVFNDTQQLMKQQLWNLQEDLQRERKKFKNHLREREKKAREAYEAEKKADEKELFDVFMRLVAAKA